MSEPRPIDQKLETLFNAIETERMQDIPILNKALEVRAVDFKVWGDFYCGVLITPWFMNLMLVPESDKTMMVSSQPVGAKLNQQFPAGTFEFIVGHEPAIGKYLMCSLFSPMFEFSDMETATLTAETVMAEIMSDRAENEEDPRDAEMQQIWAGDLPADTVTPLDGESEKSESRGHNNRPEANSNAEDQHIALSSRQYSRRELLSAFRSEAERPKS